MAERLLKAKKGRITPKRDAVAETSIVLVGTYREGQLAWIKKNGVYNYPVKDDDELTDETCGKIKVLWLYADVKSTRHAFAAEFMSKMSREEFVAAYPTYAKLGKSRARRVSFFGRIGGAHNMAFLEWILSKKLFLKAQEGTGDNLSEEDAMRLTHVFL